MADALSDEAWATICAAAERTPDAGTRAALSALLYKEYPGFRYDAEKTAATRRRAERMLKAVAALEADYQMQFTLQSVQDEDEDENAVAYRERTERDLWGLKGVRQRAEAVWLLARTIQNANARRASEQDAWIYHRLCDVWLYDFHAKLRYDTSGGEPHGPLVEFILAAMRQIKPEDALPARWTVRDAIDRWVLEHANAKRFGKFLRRRRPLPLNGA
jgi:hypothetical protein